MNNDKDTNLLQEAYEHVQEGVFDRLKAKTAGVIGGAKGLGQQAAGLAKGAVAGATGNVAGVEAATAQRAAGSVQGMDAKSLSLVNGYLGKINKAFTGLETDLRKLGMDVEVIRQTNPEAAAALTSVKSALAQLTGTFTGKGNRAAAVSNLQQGSTPQSSYNANTTSSERDMMQKLGLNQPSG